MNLVSICCINVRMNAISLRALSNITLGSCDVQRKQLGAITIAKLLASIFVICEVSGFANICAQKTVTANENIERQQLATTPLKKLFIPEGS